jgi:hypothetical protein
MTRLIAIALIILFSAVNVGFAAEKMKSEEKSKTKAVKVEKKVKTEKTKEIKVKGKKTEAPKGVKKAAEKGKGEKKGLFQRWFGGSKEKGSDTEKAKTPKVKK